MRRYYLLTVLLLLVEFGGSLAWCNDSTESTRLNTPEVLAYKRVRDSVVNLRGKKTVPDTAQTVSFQPQVKRVNGMGTGVVIDARGYVLTNYHVI